MNFFYRFIDFVFHGRNDKRLLTGLVVSVLSVAFVTTAILSYEMSRRRMHELIVSSDLPLTSDTIYSEIQRDFFQPIQASATMAGDTFLRDWALHGENDVQAIQKFLAEQRRLHNAFTAYFVSTTSLKYYTPDGILKTVSPTDDHDVWFFDLKKARDQYVVQVDTDQSHDNALTVFINYRVLDYQNNTIGITGMGLNVDTLSQLIGRYQSQFGRTIYFIDEQGKVVVWGGPTPPFAGINDVPELSKLAPRIFGAKGSAFEYERDGKTHLLNARYVPELKWYLFVERIEDEAIGNIREALYINLLIALAATALVALIIATAVNRFHAELDKSAMTDALTGLSNRRAFNVLFAQAVRSGRRIQQPISLVLFDIDHFKSVNDKYGHLSGDVVLKSVASTIAHRCRSSDIACRWGGEELLVLLQNCPLQQATSIADAIRQDIEQTAISVDGQAIQVTTSAGVTEMTATEGQHEALARTDEALYAAKKGGRNRVISTVGNMVPA